MQVAFIGDPHFGRKVEHAIVRKYVSEGQAKWFESLAIDLRTRGIKKIFITGDIFDTRNAINVEALVHAKRMFETTLADFDVTIVLGNHDMYYENSYDITSIEMIEHLPNVTVYRKEIANTTLFGKKLYIVPWVIESELENFGKFLERISNTRNDNILFGHFEMIGIDMEGGNVSTFGVSPNDFANAASRVISGHYHGKSEQTIDGTSIQYIGSPYPMTFANSDSDHGYWIMNEDLSMEFVLNTISPTFRTIMDTGDIDARGDLSNSFVRLYMNNSRTKEELFAVRNKVEARNPLLIVPLPYKDGSIEVNKSASQRDANQMLNMDNMALSLMYLETYEALIPKLKTNPDGKKAIIDQIADYNKKLGI